MYEMEPRRNVDAYGKLSYQLLPVIFNFCKLRTFGFQIKLDFAYYAFLLPTRSLVSFIQFLP